MHIMLTCLYATYCGFYGCEKDNFKMKNLDNFYGFAKKKIMFTNGSNEYPQSMF